MPLACPWSRRTALRLGECGVDVHVVDFADESKEGWLSTRHEFVADSVRAFRESVAGVHLIESSITSSRLRYLLLGSKLRRILEKCRADVFLALEGGGYAVIGYLSGFRPYGVYVIGSDVLLARGIRRQMARVALGGAETLFVNGGYLAERTRGLVPRVRAVPLLLGIDTDAFTPADPPASPVKIVCTRPFLPVYNNEYLIRALTQVPDDVVDYELTFVSPGPLLDEARALADRVLSPRTRSRVRFLGGVTHEQLIDLVRHAHIYVSCSVSDGTSGSLLEAMSCGLFPVLSDIPQNHEWVDDRQQNGILFPLDQPAALARAFIEALSQPERRARVRMFNVRQVTDRADSRTNIRRLAAYLEEMARARTSRVVEVGT
jgi:glycosyltransferase involved in cell wall biosynthesis